MREGKKRIRRRLCELLRSLQHLKQIFHAADFVFQLLKGFDVRVEVLME